MASLWGLAAVQLDATDPAMRPRELSESGRRDLAAAVRRRGLVVSGIDCFVPVNRFEDGARVARSMEAVVGCLVLSEALGRPPVCVHLPGDHAATVRDSLLRESERRGVPLADFTAGSVATWVGVDPAASIAAGSDPVAEVHRCVGRLAAARVVDLLPGGARGPIGEPRQARLDAMGYRLALEMTGFSGHPVIDCRHWTRPAEGVRSCIDRWLSLLPATESRV